MEVLEEKSLSRAMEVLKKLEENVVVAARIVVEWKIAAKYQNYIIQCSIVDNF